MKCLILLIPFFSLVTMEVRSNSVQPEIAWHRSYNGSGEESHPHYVIETKDLGFLMVGETGFVEDNSARIFLVKTDQMEKRNGRNSLVSQEDMRESGSTTRFGEPVQLRMVAG
jgi:hypothetical protein